MNELNRHGQLRPASNCLLFALLLATLTSLAFATTSAPAGADNNYQIAPGDTVAIKVFGEAELSPRVKVDESGNIDYPLLGVISVSGLSTQQLAARIQAGLKGPYLVDPKVSVSVSDYRPFYIHGQVRSPGSYAFEPGLTIRKAVALAGGLSDHASTRKMFRLPEGRTDGNQRVRVGLDDAVLPGDTITIEQSFF